MREVDRMRLLVCDACDTMSRMNDGVLAESAEGISAHLEDILLNSTDDKAKDVFTSSLVVAMAILKPLAEQMLATTNDRYSRSKSDNDDDDDDENCPMFRFD